MENIKLPQDKDALQMRKVIIFKYWAKWIDNKILIIQKKQKEIVKNLSKIPILKICDLIIPLNTKVRITN